MILHDSKNVIQWQVQNLTYDGACEGVGDEGEQRGEGNESDQICSDCMSL